MKTIRPVEPADAQALFELRIAIVDDGVGTDHYLWERIHGD